ncbi:hypothetical protein [Mycolicibacterium sp.]|uniref:hypothetical protein n=1 Tax=Mycolicibacterium sp. TaxID=2320850 RepID=UPI0037C8E1DA
MSELLWISVPGGIRDTTAILRVLIVPKLDGGTLAEHGMATWPPPILRSGPLRIEVWRGNDSPPAAAALVRNVVPIVADQSGAWQTLMDRMTIESAMNNRAARRSGLTVHETSLDADAIRRTLDVASGEPVTAGQSALNSEYRRKVRAAILADHQPDAARTATRSPAADPPRPTARAAAQPAGFHRTLSMLREHPAILRALGLIIDVELDAGDIPQAGGSVRVSWPGRPTPIPAVTSPRTRFDGGFYPAATDDLGDGMVNLGRTDEDGVRKWGVATVDIDVAAQRMRDAARALQDRPHEPVAVPALRSAGLQLVLRGRGEAMQTRMARSGDAAAVPDVLTADDLVLGYRIDVATGIGSDDWRSLQRRAASYRIHRRLAGGQISSEFTAIGGGSPVGEEGHIKTNAAIEDDTGLHADEIVAAWRGWSLAAPRPSFERGSSAVAPPIPDMNISMDLQVEAGSLPRLRFGKDYTLRARVADIAGGGVAFDESSDAAYHSEVVFYRRYEPILTPQIRFLEDLPLTTRGPGETALDIVVRSDPVAGGSMATWAAAHSYRLDAERTLAAPMTTQSVAEQHGMFDGVSPTQSWEWANRAVEAGGLPDPAAAGVAVVEPRDGAPNIVHLAWHVDEPWHSKSPAKLRVVAGAPGQASAVSRVDDAIQVRLAPAERMTLELSSFPDAERLDDFNASLRIPDGQSTEAARLGRHPLLSPATTMTFVHAVPRPLRAPDTTLIPSRTAGDTSVALSPNSDVLHPKSTSQLDVTASWDDEINGKPINAVGVPVTSLRLNVDDPVRPQTLFRHDFGDTRHRTVTYKLSAVTRFRESFRKDDPGPFNQERTLAPVIIPSTSRPPTPIIRSTTTAFAWTESGNLDTQDAVFTRERSASRVRVTLNGPWHCTGLGEALGVLVNTTDGSAVSSDALSRAGHDPIYPSRGEPGRHPTTNDIVTGKSARVLPVPGVNVNAMVRSHAPTRVDDKTWVCDVGLAPDFEHTIVDLAVARFQANSLDGLWLSPMVKTDSLPILPARTVRITRTSEGFVVELTGKIAGTTAVNRVDFIIEQFNGPDGVDSEEVDLIGVENPPGQVASWRGSVIHATAIPAAPGQGRWRKTIPKSLKRRRLRIREIELIPNTAETLSSTKSGTAGELNERTVFTDIIPLPPF